MYTAQQIHILETGLNMAKVKLMQEAQEGLTKNEKYNVCIHIQGGRYTASIWEKERSYNVSQEQNEYCKEIQQYLCSIKN